MKRLQGIEGDAVWFTARGCQKPIRHKRGVKSAKNGLIPHFDEFSKKNEQMYPIGLSF
jgi:hypothetical protein